MTLPSPPKYGHWLKGAPNGGGLYAWLEQARALINAGGLSPEQLTSLQSTLDDYQAGVDATDVAVAGQVNTEGSNTRDAVDARADARVSEGLQWEVAERTPLGLMTHDAVQAAANAARINGTKLHAAGAYTTDATLDLRCDCDLSGLTITYTGAGIPVYVGGSTFTTADKDMSLPKVLNGSKTGLGWSGSTTGIRLLNIIECRIKVPSIVGFTSGLHLRGEGVDGDRGCAYNVITLGHLDNNKVNLRIDHSGTGFANQNTFFGGRFSHNSGEGSRVPGVAHIVLNRDAGATNNPPNNNVFINPSIESPGVTEYTLDVNGFANIWMAPRFERWNGAPWVRWNANATRNLIMGGVGVEDIVESHTNTSFNNSVIGTSSHRFMSTDARGTVFENDGSSTNAAFTIMPPGATWLGYDPVTQYVGRMQANGDWKAGRPTEAFDRVQLSGLSGTLRLGTGNVAPVAGLDGINTTLFVSSGTTTFGPIGTTTDLGTATAYRFRDINAARYVRLGDMILRNNAGVLEKSLNGGTSWTVIG